MECSYPTIHEFYRDGNSEGNRKIFVRIRIPKGMTRDYKVVLHSLTTQRDAVPYLCDTAGAPVHILTLEKTTTEDYVLLIADENETNGWSSSASGNLAYASTKKQRVVPEPVLIQLVNPTTQITTEIREKLDTVMNGDKSVTFTPAEKKAIAYNPSIRITTVGDMELFQSAVTKTTEGLTLTKEEDDVYKRMDQNPHTELGGDVVMDALRITHDGPVWLVRQKRDCAGAEGIPPLGEEWCKNLTPNTTAVYPESIPYETIVPMRGKYPGTCDRSHFDYDQGVCRMTAGGEFMLMGFDNGIAVPIFHDCIAGDLKKNEGETEEQFRARKRGVALGRGEQVCKDRIPSFDTKAKAVRHCQKHGCTTIVHDELGKVLSKPWAATIGSTQMITTGCDNLNSEEECQQNHRCTWTDDGVCTSGVTTSMATSIDRTGLGVVPAALCRFCDVPGVPTSYGRVQRDNCCLCGGGDFRRFYSVPIYNLVSPFDVYEKPKHAVEIINTGQDYRVGDLLRVESTAVPYGRGGVVRVTKVHNPNRLEASLKNGEDGSPMTCEQTCESFGARCMSDDCDSSSNGACQCGPPGDTRAKGGILEVVVVHPGEDYESGAPLYKLLDGSGSDATLRIYSVDIRGGIMYTPPTIANTLSVIIASSVAAVGLLFFGGLWYRGYRRSAGTVLLLGVIVALLVGFLVRAPPPNVPGKTRKKVKSSSACSEGETLNTVSGACEDESIALTRLRKLTGRY